jgi:DNA-binding transcriptional ArsR family regulator
MPPLLPILRSQQQGRILALLLGEPEVEYSLTQLASRAGVPHPSVHREVERAENAGLVLSRRVGNVRLVRANTESPYYVGLADVLTKAFGVPYVLGSALADLPGLDRAMIFGSWAARATGGAGSRPVGDIDLLVLGDPDRSALFDRLKDVHTQLGRTVQVTIRAADWLELGRGAFHDAIANQPRVEVDLQDGSSGVA